MSVIWKYAFFFVSSQPQIIVFIGKIMTQEQKTNTRIIRNEKFGGERPLFATHDLRLEKVTITDGESGIKQCQNIEAYDCKFYGKYPWWHVDGAKIDNCYFALGSRSAIWYTNDLVMTNSRIDGPKFFREMKNLTLENVEITDATRLSGRWMASVSRM